MSRWNDAAERNRRMVAENAEKILADTHYDRFRTPRALRSLVLGYAVATAAIPVCWVRWGTIAGIGSVLVVTALYLLVRVAVRSLADLPDHVLDERMRRDRDRVYVESFRIVSNAALIPVAFSDDATLTFDYHDVSAVYWPLLALLLGTPSLVLAARHSTAGTR